jgi:hypothetical protein
MEFEDIGLLFVPKISDPSSLMPERKSLGLMWLLNYRCWLNTRYCPLCLQGIDGSSNIKIIFHYVAFRLTGTAFDNTVSINANY